MAKKQFKSESKKLLDLMINSIYTKKEIFLRELISNASDAIDKLAYIALTDDKVGIDRSDFAITLTADKEKHTLTISDNGIGMSADELESNLGTIAKSGSQQFAAELENPGDTDIIGRFGVGFYSAFMVADRITVITRKYGEDGGNKWQSSGADGYTITPFDKNSVGTDVIIELKADTDDEKYSRFCEEFELRELVKKYSDYIRFPIKTLCTKSRQVETDETDADGKKKTKTESYTELDTLNTMVPVWKRNKKELKADDYTAFYREHFYDYEEPTLYIHAAIEGAVSFNMLLFVPAKAPYDYFTKDYKKGLQLYSSGVMITENCEELLPDYFRFVRGVVDSEDLSLNISREVLQQDRQVKLIASTVEKRIKSELKKLLETDREKYEKFFAAFGIQLKYGAVSDYGAHIDMVRDLLLFRSAADGKPLTLDEYTKAMPEEQKKIYYATGESCTRIEQQPQYAAVRAKGFDVLTLTDEVDEFAVGALRTHGEKEFCNILTEDAGLLTDDEKKQAEQKAEASKSVTDFVKETLGDKVKEVRIGTALGDHPVCMVADGMMSFEMEKYFKRVSPEFAQNVGRILELNADSAIFSALSDAVDNDKDTAAKYAELLYCQGLLTADLPLDDPAAYTSLVCELIAGK